MSKVSQTNFCKACSGTVMVELAIILPLLLLLLFGITELGRALYQQNILTQAVELGGRYMARVGGAVNTDCSPNNTDGRWGNAVTMAKSLIMCGIDTGCDEDNKPVLPNITFTNDPDNSFIVTQNSNTSGTVSACVIRVKATADFISIFGADLIVLPGYRLGGVTLNASTQERYTGI